jgi:DUF3052 family protein
VGLEAECDATFGGRTSRGKARLEEKELLFRGEFRVRVPLAEIRAVQERAGRLSVEWTGGKVSLDLGPQAPRWADKIRNPRGLMDKLGLKPGQTVSVLDLPDEDVSAQIRERVPEASFGKLRKDSDLILLGLQDAAGLSRLLRAVSSLRPDGAIWVVWPKGRPSFREDDIRAFGPQAGLVDVKVVSVSDTLSGLKMMIPVARRPRRLTPPRSRT